MMRPRVRPRAPEARGRADLWCAHTVFAPKTEYAYLLTFCAQCVIMCTLVVVFDEKGQIGHTYDTFHEIPRQAARQGDPD